jgi:transcriptional regulator with XRE-family HTH domain
VREVRQAIGLTLPDFARMTGFSVRSIASWERGAKMGGAGLRRIQEIRALQQALCALAVPGSVGTWLLAPNEEFGGLKPLEVVERGDVHRLWQMIYWLRSGVPS